MTMLVTERLPQMQIRLHLRLQRGAPVGSCRRGGGGLAQRTGGGLGVHFCQDRFQAARDGLPAWARLRGEVIALSGFTVVPENDADGP